MTIHASLIAFILVHSPSGQQIEIQTREIVSLRQPHKSAGHFAPGTKCLIFTVDGKFVSVVETCMEIHQLIDRSRGKLTP